jgi:hypothetical protein
MNLKTSDVRRIWEDDGNTDTMLTRRNLRNDDVHLVLKSGDQYHSIRSGGQLIDPDEVEREERARGSDPKRISRMVRQAVKTFYGLLEECNVRIPHYWYQDLQCSIDKDFRGINCLPMQRYGSDLICHGRRRSYIYSREIGFVRKK